MERNAIFTNESNMKNYLETSRERRYSIGNPKPEQFTPLYIQEPKEEVKLFQSDKKNIDVNYLLQNKLVSWK